MKRLFIAFVSVLCLVVSVTYQASAEDTKRVKLTVQNESFMGTDDEIYRDLSYYVSVTHLVNEHLLEILHFGIGDGEVYLLDDSNEIVDQTAIYEGTSIDYLYVPAQSGNYKLVIWTHSYYGEAYFQK